MGKDGKGWERIGKWSCGMSYLCSAKGMLAGITADGTKIPSDGKEIPSDETKIPSDVLTTPPRGKRRVKPNSLFCQTLKKRKNYVGT